jgi:DNA-binding response OmpR family regulator
MAQPHNILYVIGDIATSLSCKRILEEQGYAVACVTDAELIYTMSRQRRVDLVLIDIAALRRPDNMALRIRRTHPWIPIVILSSRDVMLDGDYAWADGFATNSNCPAVLETVKTVLAA